MTFVSIVGFIVVLGIIILVHEWGHFYFARRAGILCHEFSIGMGPLVYQKKINETYWSLRAIPIGGYVLMAGEEASQVIKQGQMVRISSLNNKITEIILDVKDEKYQKYLLVQVVAFDLYGKDQPMFLTVQGEETLTYSISSQAMIIAKNSRFQVASYERSIESKSIWQRFLTIFAGPMMNILLAVVIFIGIGLLLGRPNVDSLELGEVLPNSPAEVAGLVEGAVIQSINGVTVSTWADLSNQRDASNFTPLQMIYTIDGQTLETIVNPRIIFYAAGFASDFEATGLVVDGVTERSLAGLAGMLNGDVIQGINGTPVSAWYDVATVFSNNTSGELVTLTVLRGSSLIDVRITPYEEAVVSSQGVPLVAQQIGINASTSFDLLYAVQYGFAATLGSVTSIVDTVRLIFSSNQVGVSDLAGPVGIFTITSQAVSQGFISLLGWMGLLSVNVAVINLLPIPALDGGRLLFLGIEAVSRRQIDREVENKIHTAMFFMLLAFFVFITWNDILRLIG
jgi:regulator of sigma E protease